MTGIPETFRDLKIPDWHVPDDLERWNRVDRPRTRSILLQCLGEMPPRTDPTRVRVRSYEEFEGYTLERFEFHNGVDMAVPGILALPRRRTGAVPVIRDRRASDATPPDPMVPGMLRADYRLPAPGSPSPELSQVRVAA